LRLATISGTSSEVGKTTLLCQLLERLPGWAAVKVTRGHYRSCGRDPETCCVSHLLGPEPRVFGDRPTTDAPGKDTGRYWAAGAADVRWVVGAHGQEVEGLERALAELAAFPGVLVEGNRMLRGVRPDLAILVVPRASGEIKPTARRILDRIDALYVPDLGASPLDPGLLVGEPPRSRTWPVWGPSDLGWIAARLDGNA
jgi:hypothetical protein